MDYEQSDRKQESVYSKRLKAGKRRTYFFDVRETRGNDYYLTITESRKRFNDDGYDRHKIFLYKEDFNKFVKALGEAVDYVKTDLMPDYDFDSFSHEFPEGEGHYASEVLEKTPISLENQSDIAPTDTIESADSDIVSEVVAPKEENAEEVSTTSMINNNLHSEEVDKW